MSDSARSTNFSATSGFESLSASAAKRCSIRGESPRNDLASRNWRSASRTTASSSAYQPSRMIRSICRARSEVISAETLGILRSFVATLLRMTRLRASLHRPQHIELHQLLERDRRVEIFSRQPQRLAHPLQDPLHPERQLMVARRLHVLLRRL